LAILKSSKITKVQITAHFVKLGGVYTKTLPFYILDSNGNRIKNASGNAYTASYAFSSAYNTTIKNKVLWEGDTLSNSSTWGAVFLNQIKTNNKVTLEITSGSSSDKVEGDYAKSYGALGSGTLLKVDYEPL
jgi:hypothetical protein